MVKNDEGEAVPGVNIYVPDYRNYAITDDKGNYSIVLPLSAQKLIYSFVGLKTVQLDIPAGNADLTRDVVMEKDGSLEEVVVNGFFSRSKSTYTGAVQSYSADQLLKVSPTNIFQALATLDPAITVTPNNAMGSNPNNIPELILRSTTSLATNNEVGLNAPLIVIDGVEQNLQALYDIDINDIETVQILKDASATSLYGENAANGVIIIERKRVSQSPVRIRYTFTPTISFADLSSYDLCNSGEKLELERLAGLYSSPSNDGSLDKSYYDKLELVSSGINTDWKSKPIRNSFSHDHSISISGRGQGLDYNITGSYGKTAGVMKNDYRTRYNLGMYLSYIAVKNLIITLRASHNEVRTRDSKYGNFSSYCEANPYDSPYDEYGNLAKNLSYDANNPLYEASLGSFSKSETRDENLSVDIRYNFMPNLYITAQGSYLSSRGTSDKFVSPESNIYASTQSLSDRGEYQLGNTGSKDWSGRIVGNYIHSFDDAGTMLTLNVGGEIKRQTSYSRYLDATGFLSDDLSDVVYATKYPDRKPGGTESVKASVGVFGSANFVYRNRYFVDGSYRLSGSSTFGENNRYAPFWSVGVGYNLHNEKFAKDLEWFNTFRIRSSYGYTGSVKFDAFQAITTYNYNSDLSHYAGVGAVPMGMSNPDLTWQTTKKLNVGATTSFLGDRLNINTDYYIENTDDMLIDLSLPPSSGDTSVKYNLGSQKSKGFEFSVWGKVVRNKDWEWILSFNGLHNSSVIKNISNALKRMNEENAGTTTTPSPRVQFREGESPTAIYAVRSAGIDPASGKEIFIKKDGTTYTYTYDADDQVAVGNTNPKLQGSFSTTLTYKWLSLNMNFSYRFGGDMYNATRVSKIENINPQKNVDVRAFTERWKAPGDVVPYLDISTTGGTSYVYSDRFVEKDNELWFSNLTLQYNLPVSYTKKMHVQKMYVGIGTEDLFRLTSAKYERGTYYPYSRNVNFTVNVTF